MNFAITYDSNNPILTESHDLTNQILATQRMPKIYATILRNGQISTWLEKEVDTPI